MHVTALMLAHSAPGIFPENTGSVALHRAAGFHNLGRRERLGEWRDAILIEGRSNIVGP